MALQLFCDKCRQFIKEVNSSEAANIGDGVVCQKCVDTAYAMRTNLEKEYKKLSSQLAGAYNKAIVQLEDVIHKALE